MPKGDARTGLRWSEVYARLAEIVADCDDQALSGRWEELKLGGEDLVTAAGLVARVAQEMIDDSRGAGEAGWLAREVASG